MCNALVVVVDGQVQGSRLCVRDEWSCSSSFPHPSSASSWWWAYKCPKHVEQIISAISHSVASSWFYSLRIYNDARTNKHQIPSLVWWKWAKPRIATDPTRIPTEQLRTKLQDFAAMLTCCMSRYFMVTARENNSLYRFSFLREVFVLFHSLKSYISREMHRYRGKLRQFPFHACNSLTSKSLTSQTRCVLADFPPLVHRGGGGKCTLPMSTYFRPHPEKTLNKQDNFFLQISYEHDVI